MIGGDIKLRIDISESEKEERSVSNASGSSSESFDLGIEWFGRGVGGPVIEEVQYRLVMRLYRPGYGLESIDTCVIYLIVPDGERFESPLLVFAVGKDAAQANG